MNAPVSTTPAAVPASGATVPGPSASGATVATPQPIPYRKESSGVGGSVIGVLLVTVVVLAAFVLVLRMAKSRGMLDRWVVAPLPRDAARQALQVEQSLRVGSRTTVHRIRDGERRYLLVESMAPGVQLLALEDEHPASTENGHDDTL
jgi:hypothetical protein